MADPLKPACKNCRAWKADNTGWGECRRYAPRTPPEQIKDVTMPYLWPETSADDWCAEFIPPVVEFKVGGGE